MYTHLFTYFPESWAKINKIRVINKGKSKRGKTNEGIRMQRIDAEFE